MALTVDSIQHLTRAHIGARVFQGLLFWFALVQNIKAALTHVGYPPNPRLQMWLTLSAIVAAAALGTFYRWRFGRVEPARPSRSRRPFEDFRYGVVGATAVAMFTIAVVMAIFVTGREAGVRPMDLALLLLSAYTATSLATSRGQRLGWVVPVLASAVLLVTFLVPVLQPYRALGHAGMAAALVVTAVQLHLFLVRGFRHAHV
ncbi:MAG: hypothetical protein SH850_31520 [Planctomycetaceae bacterium]|nr:hypothetical protein [Planctomycetaceae bacterium]